MRSSPSFALVGRVRSPALVGQVVSHVVSGGVGATFDPSEPIQQLAPWKLLQVRWGCQRTSGQKPGIRC